jgi:hypothetical protein
MAIPHVGARSSLNTRLSEKNIIIIIVDYKKEESRNRGYL